MDTRPDLNPATCATRPAPSQDGQIASEALFGGRREIVILHKGREYRLRLTQNDKLILTA